jgi:predicted enzyme related to lactoylglutathione lyase
MSINPIVYPVQDLAKAKVRFSALLGVEPYTDTPYYVGYRVGDQEIGLDPNGHRDGLTPYFEVDDIRDALGSLAAGGAATLQDVKDVGGGKLTASAKDPDGNIIGLIQNP